MFEAAIDAAQPVYCLPPHLPAPPSGRTVVVGAGKAAAAMAQALERHWKGDLSGLVVTRYGYAVPCRQIEVVEAAHPVPDLAGMQAAARMLEMVRGLTRDDLVICLFSGGGSALLPLPLDGLTLQDEQQISRMLLKSGAAIREINCVRRHLSAIKGGRLAAACFPARVATLLISDVPGDNLVDIASGPTVADSTTCADALRILKDHGIPVPQKIRRILEGGRGETLKPGDNRFENCTYRIIARSQSALEAAARVARGAGFAPLILGDSIEGEARQVGRDMARLAIDTAQLAGPVRPPCILLSGGETTVTVRGSGCGGRNVEFLLSLALTLNGHPHIHAIAGDTDGVDGMAEIAGAIVTPGTLTRAAAAGLDAEAILADNDAHRFFAVLGDSVVTGPTLTNVNDFRAILIAHAGKE